MRALRTPVTKTGPTWKIPFHYQKSIPASRSQQKSYRVSNAPAHPKAGRQIFHIQIIIGKWLVEGDVKERCDDQDLVGFPNAHSVIFHVRRPLCPLNKLRVLYVFILVEPHSSVEYIDTRRYLSNHLTVRLASSSLSTWALFCLWSSSISRLSASVGSSETQGPFSASVALRKPSARLRV